jgi:predicted dehydrogenase
LASARHAVVECRRKKTALTINYYKRFEAGIQHLKSRAKRIGPVHTVIGTYTGPFDAVGSHMVDTLRYLFGDLSVAYSDGSTAVLKGANGLKAILNQAGQREDFIFELDAIGKNGRYLLADNFQTVEAKVFVKSPRYGGYRELVRTKNPLLRPADRFLPMFKEIHAAALNGKAALTCSGADALKTQELMDVIARGKRK